jgi:hypothetical protein
MTYKKKLVDIYYPQARESIFESGHGNLTWIEYLELEKQRFDQSGTSRTTTIVQKVRGGKKQDRWTLRSNRFEFSWSCSCDCCSTAHIKTKDGPVEENPNWRMEAPRKRKRSDRSKVNLEGVS